MLLSCLPNGKTTLWMCTTSQKGDNHKNLDFRPDFYKHEPGWRISNTVDVVHLMLMWTAAPEVNKQWSRILSKVWSLAELKVQHFCRWKNCWVRLHRKSHQKVLSFNTYFFLSLPEPKSEQQSCTTIISGDSSSCRSNLEFGQTIRMIHNIRADQ